MSWRAVPGQNLYLGVDSDQAQSRGLVVIAPRNLFPGLFYKKSLGTIRH